MIEFLGILGFGVGAFMAGYFFGNKKPLLKPEKEIKYITPYRAGEHRAFPEHPPVPPVS